MSTRDNEERFGAAQQHSDPPRPAPTEQSLQFTAPTEFVDLPSKGKYYPDDHPLHGVTSIEMKYMTAKDEDILVNKSYIKKGVVLDRLLQSLIVDKSIHIDSLLSGDKNALLINARINGYGSDYTVKVACPACSTATDYEFDLIESCKVVEPELNFSNAQHEGGNIFSFELPVSKATVQVKLLFGSDERNIFKTTEMRTKNKLGDLGMTDYMKMYIHSVNGNTDLNYINNCVDNMSVLDSKAIRNTYKTLTPTVELAQQFQCPSCDYEQELEVPLTSEFFWPK